MRTPGVLAGRFSYTYLHFHNTCGNHNSSAISIYLRMMELCAFTMNYFGAKGYATALVSELPTPL